MGKSLKSFEIEALREEIKLYGVGVVRDFFDGDFITELSASLIDLWGAYQDWVDASKRSRAGEEGIIRALPALRRIFLQLASDSQILEIVDLLLTNSAILHLGNGFVSLPSEETGRQKRLFQSTWHRDFPRNVATKSLSVNFFIPLTRTAPRHAATEFLIGSHASDEALERHLESCPVRAFETVEGDLILFDSTIWHRAGPRDASKLRLAINLQYSHHWIKQQMDLSRLIGYSARSGLSHAERRVLGFNARVPASFEEFYVSPSERLYQPGQG